MTDLVKRLRNCVKQRYDIADDLVLEAADEIERLEERVAELQTQCGYTESINTLEIERLTAALRDLIDRWSTERGYDGAIQRARALLLEHDLRSPATEAVRNALEKP
jgi:hypothetical protein